MTKNEQKRSACRGLNAAVMVVTLLLSATSSSGQIAAEPVANPAIYTYGIEINVNDMDKALAFYNGKLGFAVEDRHGYPQYVILKSDDREKLILHRVKQLRTQGQSDTGLSFTLQVNDLDQAIERMKTLGVEFAEKEKRKEAVGNAISIKDPFGRSISLMHQTIVKVEPFKEPKLYNFGFAIPDMQLGREFYANKLGFAVRSERYLPLDLPLGHADKTFAFMLHYRDGVVPLKSNHPNSADFNTAVFSTANLPAAVERLKQNGVKILEQEQSGKESYVMLEDPFGNVSKLLEVK